jgi:hypothetical protein
MASGHLISSFGSLRRSLRMYCGYYVRSTETLVSLPYLSHHATVNNKRTQDRSKLTTE